MYVKFFALCPTASSFAIAIYRPVSLLEDLMLTLLQWLIIQYYRVMIIVLFFMTKVNFESLYGMSGFCLARSLAFCVKVISL